MDLKIFNTWTKFEGSSHEIEQVKEFLSILDDKRFFSRLYRRKIWDGYHRFYSEKRQVFPSGLLNFVLARCEKNHLDVNCLDLRVRPELPPNSTYDLTDFNPRDYQTQAARLAVKQSRAIIRAATNSGKTEIAAMIIQYLNLETLYLVHRNELMIQTKKRFEERGLSNIGMIGGGQYDCRKINICMVQTLYAHRGSLEVRELLNNAKVLFADECHRASSKSWYNLIMACDAFYRYGLSATPMHNDLFSDMRLLGATGSVLPLQIDNELLIKEGYSALPYVLMLETPRAHLILPSKTYAAVYRAYIVENEARNRTIVGAAEALVRQKKQVMVIVRQIVHGEKLLELFNQSNQVLTDFVSGESGYEARDAVLDRFRKGSLDVLVTSVIFDEGIDVPQVDVIILGVGERSPIRLLQRIGRGMRKKQHNYLCIVDFEDRDHLYVSRHMKERLQIYEQEKFKVFRGDEAEKVLSDPSLIENESLYKDDE